MNYGLEMMLNELESHRLEVVLAPLNPRMRGYNDGGCKRVRADQNPKWYREFCSNYASSRGVRRGKFDTRIRRQNILSVLRRMVHGARTWSKYADDLRVIARRHGRMKGAA